MKNKTSVFVLTLFVSLSISAQNKKFEGEIVYKNTITIDKTTQKLYSWARNGVYEDRVFIKGKNRLEENDYLDMKTLIIGEKDVCYIWNDLTKTGFTFVYSEYINYLKKIGTEYSEVLLNNIQETGETKDFFGYTCKHYKGELKEKINMQLVKLDQTKKKDYWVCNELPNVMDEEDFPGLPFKFEINVSARVPLLGSLQNYQSCEISSITTKNVDDKVFEIPSDITFKTSSDGYGSIRKIAKEVRKYKKKNKIEDNKVDANGASEEGSFDF